MSQRKTRMLIWSLTFDWILKNGYALETIFSMMNGRGLEPVFATSSYNNNIDYRKENTLRVKMLKKCLSINCAPH